MANDEQNDQQHDIRGALLAVLMKKVEEDQYPSATMMDLIEQELTDEQMSQYARVLLEKIQADTYPSIDLIRRLTALC